MTEVVYSPKIKPEHLARKAIVYLRQSSEKQVRQNKESQHLQYAVAERVRALGWTQVDIINSDLGSSAGIASAQREGFERVLSLVALGEVGIVGSREVSRLSRTDKDWCRLLEVCQIHHVTMVILAMLFIAEQRAAHQPGLALLTPRDIVEMLKETLPRKPEGKDALVSRILECHERRRAAIDSRF